MAATTSGSKSLKEYLKRYESNNEGEKKKKKKKKVKSEAKGVLVVDEDPVWQRQVNLDEEEDNDSADESKPVVDEDIEVKRMRRLEQIRSRRPFNAISEDGSGWISLSLDANNVDQNSDISPPRKRRIRNDTPSPEPELSPLDPDVEDADLSPPRQRRAHHPAPSSEGKSLHSSKEDADLSPPRQRRTRHLTPAPGPDTKPGRLTSSDFDMSPPRKQRARNDTPSPKGHHRMKAEEPHLSETSYPRRARHSSLHEDNLRPAVGLDLSPPRKSRKEFRGSGAPDFNSQRLHTRSIDNGGAYTTLGEDLSPPRKSRNESTGPSASKDLPKTGLISGRDIRDEISKIRKDDTLRFEQMDPSMSGRGAEPIYRDKRGERISKDDYMKSKQKLEEKSKEIKIEWGKGLAQKREAEARLQELELEKDKPFARTRDDPELDKMLKDRLRWGDPMAHLVKKKHSELVLPNLGDNEKMKESGFIVPQEIPSHSWIKRGLEAAPNRYGIKPGRHWDGVDRSNGYEKQMFTRLNEKQATQREAYLWSVSDM